MSAPGRSLRSRYGCLPEPVPALLDLAEVLTDITAGFTSMTAGVGHLVAAVGATGGVDPARQATVLAAVTDAMRALHEARDATSELLEHAADNAAQARP